MEVYIREGILRLVMGCGKKGRTRFDEITRIRYIYIYIFYIHIHIYSMFIYINIELLMLTIQAHKCQIHSIGWDPETTSFACNLPGTDDNADEADDAGESYAEQH